MGPLPSRPTTRAGRISCRRRAPVQPQRPPLTCLAPRRTIRTPARKRAGPVRLIRGHAPSAPTSAHVSRRGGRLLGTYHNSASARRDPSVVTRVCRVGVHEGAARVFLSGRTMERHASFSQAERETYSAYVVPESALGDAIVKAFANHTPPVSNSIKVDATSGEARNSATGRPFKSWDAKLVELDGDRAVVTVTWYSA